MEIQIENIEENISKLNLIIESLDNYQDVLQQKVLPLLRSYMGKRFRSANKIWAKIAPMSVIFRKSEPDEEIESYSDLGKISRKADCYVLHDTGMLKRSLTSDTVNSQAIVTKNELIFGTTLPYAEKINNGGLRSPISKAQLDRALSRLSEEAYNKMVRRVVGYAKKKPGKLPKRELIDFDEKQIESIVSTIESDLEQRIQKIWE